MICVKEWLDEVYIARSLHESQCVLLFSLHTSALTSTLHLTQFTMLAYSSAAFLFTLLAWDSPWWKRSSEETNNTTQSVSLFQGKAVTIPLGLVFRSILAYDKCGCNHHQFLVGYHEISTKTSAPSIGIRQKKVLCVLIFASPVFRVLGNFHLLIKSLTLKAT